MEMPELPQMLKGESLARLLQGTAFGAVALAVLGFSQGFVMLSSSAEAMASQRATAAVVDVYAPICVKRFVANATSEQREGFDQASWQKDDYIEKLVLLPRRGPLSQMVQLPINAPNSLLLHLMRPQKRHSQKSKMSVCRLH